MADDRPADLRAEAEAMATGALAVAQAIREHDQRWVFLRRLWVALMLVVLLVVALQGRQFASEARRIGQDNRELLRFQRDVLGPVLCQSYAQRGTPPPPALTCP